MPTDSQKTPSLTKCGDVEAFRDDSAAFGWRYWLGDPETGAECGMDLSMALARIAELEAALEEVRPWLRRAEVGRSRVEFYLNSALGEFPALREALDG